VVGALDDGSSRWVGEPVLGLMSSAGQVTVDLPDVMKQ